MNKLRIGIIGCGIQGKFYRDIIDGVDLERYGIKKAPGNCKVTAVATSNSDTAKTFQEIPGITVFKNWKDLIESDCCDAVIITLPHLLHHEPAMYALEHGKHVLCEKPMCIRLSDAEKLVQVKEKHPELTLAMMFNQRANPLYRSIKEMVEKKELGSLRRSNWLINDWWRPDQYYTSGPWRGSYSKEGGGILVNQLPHNLDLWAWICGAPKKLFAKCIQGAYRDIPVENDITIVAEYENGVTGTIVSCTHDPLGTNRLELDFSKGKIILENGKKLTIYRFHQDEKEWNHTYDHYTFQNMKRENQAALYDMEVREVETTYGNDHSEALRNFAEHILSGETLYSDYQDGLLENQIAAAAQLSGWTGKEICMPPKAEEYDAAMDAQIAKEQTKQ